MNILLAGGQKNAYYLAKSLKSKGHEVIAINQNRNFCQMLADLNDIETVCGNGSNANILKEAHAEKMDAVIALYEQDADNLVVCELAKKQFNVRYTCAVVNDPKSAELFEGFGIDKCINTINIINDFIEQLAIEENIKKYLPVEDGRVAICEVEITRNSYALNKKLWEVGFPSQSIIACILRRNEIIIPQGNTILAVGDKVIIVSSSQTMEKTISLLIGKV